MSRFKANFEALDEKKWAGLKGRIAELSEEELQNSATQGELERLRLITEVIATSMESVQPFAEFINPAIQNEVKGFENHLNNFDTSQPQQKPSHLSQLNNSATNILQMMWPFVSQSDAAQAAGQAFDRYKSLIENEEASIRALRSEADEAIDAIRINKSDLLDYRAELLDGTEHSASIKSEIDGKLTKINEMLESTEAFYQRFTQGDAESASIQNQIVKAQTSATEDSSKIAAKLSDTERKLKELERIYADVFGVVADGEDRQGGLKSQLEERQTQLDTMVDGFGKKFNGLVDQVEDLLPGATSAGLATAYNQLRITAEKRTLRYSIAFFGLVGVLTITAAVTVTQSITIWPPSWEAITFSDTAEYFTKLLFKLPVIVPVLWAALTVSKRRSEMHRLAEEYAHKEALAKSYEGFKKQITELNTDDKGLLAELLAAMLKAVSLNAAKTLEGKHGEKMPVQEVIEEAVKSAVNQGTPK